MQRVILFIIELYFNILYAVKNDVINAICVVSKREGE
jgi:hypothetical protein